MKEIREVIAIKEGKEDTNFTLVRNAQGEIYVEIFYSPNKPFAKGMKGPKIFPKEFGNYIIDGEPLQNYVDRKLKEVDKT
jgi:hypothetical protein